MTLSANQVNRSLELFELKSGTKVRMEVLKDLLPDANTALFFGKLYKLDYRQLSHLMRSLFNTTVIQTLLSEGDIHSSSLQDYIIDIVPPAELMSSGIVAAQFISDVDHEFLPELWDMLEVQIADSIQKLVDSLDGVLSVVQGKYGKMLFSTMAVLNKQRQGIIGQFKARIAHPMVPNNLVIFDVSGSVSRATAEKIVDEVVALAYKANASLAIVSDHTYLWDAGTFTRTEVMQAAEFNGTHYETLASVFNRDWATVITIADYDSYGGVPSYLKQHCTGRVQQVLDISLVNRATFLSECIGQLADKVTPLLIGNSDYPLGYR
jgi:hypothetical protein